jgi:hypothetical protein
MAAEEGMVGAAAGADITEEDTTEEGTMAAAGAMVVEATMVELV